MDFLREDSISQKQCWVCYGTESDEPAASWVKPCRCRGSTKWVHRSCLQSWIDEKQKGDAMKTVNCPQCNTKYIIVYPKLGFLGDVLSFIDRSASFASPFVVVSGLLVSVYWSFATYGGLVVVIVMGAKPAARLFDRAPAKVLYTALPVIPVALLASKRIRWQEWILRFLHRHIWQPVKGAWPRAVGPTENGRLPPLEEGLSSASITTSRFGNPSQALDGGASTSHSDVPVDQTDNNSDAEERLGLSVPVMTSQRDDSDGSEVNLVHLDQPDGGSAAAAQPDTTAPDEVNNADGGGGNNGQEMAAEQNADGNNLMVNIDVVIDRKSFLRSVASALTLPFLSRLAGEVLYPDLTPTLYRSLLGGLTYVFGKGIFGIYYKHQKVVRQALREVKDFPEETSQTTQTAFDSDTEEVASSNGVDFDITLMAEL